MVMSTFTNLLDPLRDQEWWAQMGERSLPPNEWDWNGCVHLSHENDPYINIYTSPMDGLGVIFLSFQYLPIPGLDYKSGLSQNRTQWTFFSVVVSPAS